MSTNNLQSLTLHYATWMINNEWIMNALENCGMELKELSIDAKCQQMNNLIKEITPHHCEC